jgi:hypothetical protein
VLGYVALRKTVRRWQAADAAAEPDVTAAAT